MINFGDGADSFVAALVMQTNGMIVLGGGFTHYDGEPRQHLARVYAGTVGGSGTLEFTSGNYEVLETTTNAVLTVRRRGGTSGVLSNGVYVANASIGFATDPSGSTAVEGVNYIGVTNTLTFPPGEVSKSVNIPVLRDYAIRPTLIVSNYIANPMPAVPGGPAIGNQPGTLLSIGNVDSGVSFSAPSYFFSEDSVFAAIPVMRTGSSNGVTTVDFATTTNGTALPNVNYIPVVTNLTFADRQVSNVVVVPLLHYTPAQGDVTVVMVLSNANGSLLLNPYQSTLTIRDVDEAPGQLRFSQTNYVVSEAAGYLPVTVLRTNGQSGTVQVNFNTALGSASPGFKYIPTNGVLTFGPGQTSAMFTVPILQEDQVEGNQTFYLVLSNATAGAMLVGPTNLPVTILDDDIGLSFSSAYYQAPETAGTLSLAVFRQNGTNDTTTVRYATTNIIILTTNIYTGVVTTNLGAQPGINYVATNGSLTFNPGETAKSILLQALHYTNVSGDVSFGVNLFNPTNTGAPAKVGPISTATVILLDHEAGLSIASTNLAFVTNADFSVTLEATYGAIKSSGTNILFTIARSNLNTGTISTEFTTADGTAVQGVDYVANSGTLTFSNGIPYHTFSVQIISNRFIEGDRDFTVYLTNASPPGLAQLLQPYKATVTITDDVSGLSFSSSAYKVGENAQTATITVRRSNYTNSTVSVQYGTLDDGTGTGKPGTNYWPTSGTLVFTNGETAKTFSVQVIDNNTLDGGHTVPLYLTNPIGNAITINPDRATLTIWETDGSLVVPAGAALVSESGPTNMVIDPGETVTLLLALRNASGNSTTNLMATLLPTNGVVGPSGPQFYGVLVTNGPSASRPFTLTADGTNGQTVLATLQLRDGSTVLSNAQYTFTLGKVANTYSNSAAIVINDYTNATPYPSVIEVTNLNSLVTQATVTFTNFSHGSARDINALLVSPTGQKVLLMANCGGVNAINNATVTFDDTAGAPLPQFNRIDSGAYRPASYATPPPQFPPAEPPFPTNAITGPFASTLSVVNGTTPEGAWALYLYDNLPLFSGTIANGWMLNLALTGPLAGAADLGLTMDATSATVVTTSNVTYIITVTNYGPSGASGVAVTDTLPPGTSVAGFSAPAGTTVSTNVAGLVTWNIGALVTNATRSMELTIQVHVPATVSSIVNSATVTTATDDQNPDDDTDSVEVAVLPQTADLVLSLLGEPNPVFLALGDYVTYTLTISNIGPATATNVSLANQLPPEATFVSADPPGATIAGQIVTFTNLGDIGSGEIQGATIQVQPTMAATMTYNAVCSSGVVDPFKANNRASVKTVVQPLPLTVSRVGSDVAVSWPSSGSNYALESTTNLTPPVVWSPVTDVVPSKVGGQTTILVPIGPGERFFRLHWTSEPALTLSLSHAADTVTLAWPVNPWFATLESAIDLNNAAWTPRTSPPPSVVGDQNKLTLPIGAAGQFFRLRCPTP